MRDFTTLTCLTDKNARSDQIGHSLDPLGRNFFRSTAGHNFTELRTRHCCREGGVGRIEIPNRNLGVLLVTPLPRNGVTTYRTRRFV